MSLTIKQFNAIPLEKRQRMMRKQTCRKKIRYFRQESADKAIAEMRTKPHLYTKTELDKLRSYECMDCFGWHIGRRYRKDDK